MKNCTHSFAAWRRQSGFSLVELSVVLIVVGLIVGAVAVGTDVQRNASYQRLGSSFVNGWNLAFLSYKTKTGVVVADSQTTPTGYVNQNVTGSNTGGTGGIAEICDTSLRGYMLAAGVDMPQGRAEGMNTRYSYLDSNGNPQEMQVCFRSIPWLMETATPGLYADKVKNVMVLKQVTPDLARLIDSLVDTATDAQYGKIRQYPSLASGSNYTNPPKQEYSLNNKCVQGTGDCSVALDEAQVQTMTIYYLMD
ncbi:MAG: prepilin-type N-terminal cleavage/methylation domain-containing protein [Rhodoferax sp.]